LDICIILIGVVLKAQAEGIHASLKIIQKTPSMGKEQNMNFDLSTFRFVSDMEVDHHQNAWNNITLADLKNHVKCLKDQYGITEKDMPDVFNSVENVEVFLNAIEGDRLGDSDESDPEVLSYHMENGIIDRLYGPCFYKTDEGQFVLRVGRTLYKASLSESRLVVGSLRGPVDVTPRTNSEGKVLKDDNDNVILSVTAKLRDPKVKGNQELLYIPLILDREVKVSEALLAAALEDGNICDYMSTVPKGGGKFYDMRMLPVGDYLVTDISDPKKLPYDGKEFVSWNITIADLGIVSSRTKALQSRLEKNLVFYRMKAQNGSLCLRMSKHHVKYVDMNGNSVTTTFPEFIVNLHNNNVANLQPGKIGSKEVQHLMDVDFIVNGVPENVSPILVQTVQKIGGMISGSQDTVSLIEPSRSAAPKADEKPDNYDDIPF
jgi:hypothetical protein